ncbi:hypothetical protein [Nonomuraea soli]|uniref:Uncharacterized protein n=1 Tax=Nonomuraea soli TaxID=1032476 RepID=A0A7W0HV44_9ACTN|nr:hypothetical protein [Nonomuraea soli]MBA2896632.1 hypothetical protein [Nonomuraea soli]
MILGLLVNEMSEVSPWLANKLVRWAACRQYEDPERSAIRSEELAALINARPGKLFKLITALGFTQAALRSVTRRKLGTTVRWSAEMWYRAQAVRAGWPIGERREHAFAHKGADVTVFAYGRPKIQSAMMRDVLRVLDKTVYPPCAITVTPSVIKTKFVFKALTPGGRVKMHWDLDADLVEVEILENERPLSPAEEP